MFISQTTDFHFVSFHFVSLHFVSQTTVTHPNLLHFLSSPHNISKDMQLIPIEKIFSNRDSIRKAREAFLILKGRTIDPNGLNIREETY